MDDSERSDRREAAVVADGPDLSVVLLTKNESENLRSLVPRIQKMIETLGVRGEIVVVDDSDDDTLEVARRLNCRAQPQQGAGYGDALNQGLAAARGDYVVTIDADYSHEPEFLYHMWAARTTADVVIGSRYVLAGRAEMPIIRRLLSLILNRVFAVVLALPYRDLSSGFRLYNSRVFKSVRSLVSRDFDALEELLVIAYCDGWRIREIPIRYRPRHAGRSNVRALKFAVSYARTLPRLWRLRNSANSCDYDSRAFSSWILPQRYWQRRRFRIITDLVRGMGRCLDVGCGASQIIQALPGMVGLDSNRRKLRFLRMQDGHRWLTSGSAFALPFRTGEFAALVCSEVIEHVPKSPSLLAEMNRVLARGGSLVLGTPDYASRLWWLIERCYEVLIPGGYGEEHISHYTREELRALLADAGFAIRSERYIVFSELIIHAEKVRDAW
ncbi:MAG: glycosyltransferase [Candidatus Binatia bacterium]